MLFQQQSGMPSTKDAPRELTVISRVLLHPYLVFAGLRCTACLIAFFASLQKEEIFAQTARPVAWDWVLITFVVL